MTYKYELIDLSENYLNILLSWRNSIRVRRYMYSDEIITIEDHYSWFEKNKSDSTKINKILLLNQKPLGLVNFSNICHKNKVCNWGFYIGEDSYPKGTGTWLGYLALKYIFDEKQIRKVIGEVLSYNSASINFHSKMGFSKEGHLRKQVIKNGKYVDVLLFGQLNDDWKQNQEIIVRKIK